MKIQSITGAVMILLMAIACKPSVERETKNWDRNKNTVETLKSAYPQFASFLNKDLKKATEAWNAALKLDDAEMKAEAMDSANDQLETKMFRQLNSIKSRNSSINSGIKWLTKKTMPSSDVRKVNRLIASARDKQADSRRLLRNAPRAPRSAAQNAIDDAVGKLISANGDVSRAKKIAKKK